MNKKRILSLLLAIVMVISLVPTYVFATEGEPTDPTVTEPVVTEPVVTEPVVTEPVVTEPVVTEPAAPVGVECEVCGALDCQSTHENWCEICKVDDCGQTHEPTAPSTEATEATQPSTEPTQPSTEATEPSTEPTQPSTEATEPTQPTEPAEPEGPQVGDKIWIKSGSKVYKNHNNVDKNYYTLMGSYEVEIKKILTNDEGAAEWYEFRFTDLGIGEIALSMGGFKYVHVENTTTVKPDEQPEDEHACNCGENAPENLASHADSCPRKQYIKTLFEGKTAEEIYAQWETYDEATRNDILAMLEVYDRAKWEELNSLIYKEPEDCAVNVSGEGLPEDISLVVVDESVNEEKMAVINEINSDVFSALKQTPNASLDFYSTFNIKLYSDNAEWQPNGIKVRVTLTDIEKDLSFSKITVTHILDTVDAVQRALNDGTAIAYRADGLNEVYPAETAASGVSDTIYYVQMTNDDELGSCDVYMNEDGTISFDLDSFSTVQVTATSYDNAGGMPNIASNETGKLILDKTVTDTPNQNGEYTLTLKAHTEGELLNKETEVVFVLDHSGSMYSAIDDTYWTNQNTFIAEADKKAGEYEGYYFAARKYGDGYRGALIRYNPQNQTWERCKEIKVTSGLYTNRKAGPVFSDTHLSQWYALGDNVTYTRFWKTISGAMHTALNDFANEVEGINNCKVAVVGFASTPAQGVTETNDTSSNNGWGHKRGGMGIYVNGSIVPYKQCNDNTYADAFLDVSNVNDYNILSQTFENVLTDYHGTTTDAGFVLAKRLFAASDTRRAAEGKTDDVNRIVILFTDGDPTGRITNESTGAATTGDTGATEFKNAAINKTNDLKNTYAAKVYSFGPNRGKVVDQTFLSLMSSNYPNAKSMSDKGTQTADTYSGLADNEEDLSLAFKEIGQMIASSATTLDKTTILKDVITPTFALPVDANEENIKVYSAKFDGSQFSDTWTALSDAVVTIEGNEIKVNGYDYSKEYVTTVPKTGTVDDYGTQLVIQIPIVPRPDFLGGDKVITNENASAVYSNGAVVEYFPVPNVDIDVKDITPIGTEQNIYVSQQVNLPNAINLGEFQVGTTTYRVDGINNAYVDIVYTLNDAEGKTVTYTIPAGTPYASLTGQGWDETGGLGTHPILESDKDYTVTCQLFSKLNTDDDPNNDTTNNSDPKSDDIGVDVYKPVITFKDSAIDLGDTADYATENLVKVEWKHGNDLAPDSMGTAPTLEYTYDPPADDFKKETDVTVTEVKALKDESISVPAEMIISDHASFYREVCKAGKDGTIFPGCDHTAPILVSSGGINFTVHLNNFDIVITKDVTGNYIDPNQSFVFNVTGPNGFNMNVMVVGEGSVTIKGVPAGVYTIKELTEWSWRYICTEDEKTISAEDAVNGVTSVIFENTRNKEFWLSGDCFAENQWSDSGITANKSN